MKQLSQFLEENVFAIFLMVTSSVIILGVAFYSASWHVFISKYLEAVIAYPYIMATGLEMLLLNPRKKVHTASRYIPVILCAIIGTWGLSIIIINRYSAKDTMSVYVLSIILLVSISCILYLIWKMYIDWRKLAKRA